MLYPAELRARSPDPGNDLSGIGVSEGVRTLDGQIHSLELYQLSYTHHTLRAATLLERLEGLEPPTRG